MRIVQPRSGGRGWEVLRPGSTFPGALADSEETAVVRAREILARAGGGRLVIKSATGKVTAMEAVDRFGAATALLGDPADDDAS